MPLVPYFFPPTAHNKIKQLKNINNYYSHKFACACKAGGGGERERESTQSLLDSIHAVVAPRRHSFFFSMSAWLDSCMDAVESQLGPPPSPFFSAHYMKGLCELI